MISTIDIGPFHKVRIWIDELPAIPHSTHHAVELVAKADKQSALASRLAAIESRRIVGPRTIYGLLGATCESQGKESVVKLMVSGSADGPSRQLDWAMGNEGDPVTPDV